jgi:predicted MFS family arabinose efflux permease
VSGRVPARVVAALMLGTTLNPLNSSMIALALVDVGDAFDVSVAAAGVLVIVFYAVGAVAQPFMGRFVDRFGPRRMFLIGLVATGVVSALAPLAPTLLWLILARAALAIATSAAFPASLAMIRQVSGSSRAPAGTMGALSIAANAMAALGPVVGGAAVGLAGWQGIFLVNLPLIATGIVLGVLWLPRGERAPDAQPHHQGGAVRALLRRGDLRLVYARFVAVTLAFYGVLLGLPVWLEEVRDLPTATVGLLMAPVAGLGMLTTPLAARLIRRRGGPIAVALGAAFIIVGSVPMLAYGHATPLAGVAVAGAVLGAGLGFTNLGLQTGLYEAAPAALLGTASGLFQTCRYTGAVIASAIMGAAFAGGVGNGGIRLIGAVGIGLATLTLRASITVHRRHVEKDDQVS